MNETNFERAIYGVLLQIAAGLCGFYGLVVCNNWRLVAGQA
jgi:hypothetical protein